MPVHASELYAKNITSFLSYMIKDATLNLDLEDEIISGAMFSHNGKITNEQTSKVLEEI
jgi:NAD(P) transhydrogenase subunit alpha